MKTKVSITTLFISCFLVFIVTYSFYKLKSKVLPQKVFIEAPPCENTMSEIRLKQYSLIQPILLIDVYNESSSLNPLRTKINQYINQIKSNQKADEVSVYFRKLNEGLWFSINPNTAYNPSSMGKLIQLIAYLKEAEENPEILNKKIFFSKHFSRVSPQNIKDFVLKEKKNYSVSELLTYMIKYSDDDATILLNMNINLRIYKQIFVDLKMATPPEVGEYFITAADYSKFFRVLYNGTYLSPEHSEFGLGLLTHSTYNDGLRKGVDTSVTIAHKFGEKITGNKTQFHEFGIVYLKDDPYLIGVMTTGSSLTQLSEIVAEISRITYSEYLNLYN